MRWFDSNSVGCVLVLVASEALDVFEQHVEAESVRWRRNESEKRFETAGVFALWASWCQPLFLVFGRLARIIRTHSSSRHLI